MDAIQQHPEPAPALPISRAGLPFAAQDHGDWLRSKVLASIPDATRKSYESALKSLAPHVEGEVPDDEAVLARIRELEAQDKSVSAMRAAMSAANFYRRYTGHPPLGLAPGEAIKAIDRIRQQQGRDAKQSAPIRSSDLPRIEAAAPAVVRTASAWRPRRGRNAGRRWTRSSSGWPVRA